MKGVENEETVRYRSGLCGRVLQTYSNPGGKCPLAQMGQPCVDDNNCPVAKGNDLCNACISKATQLKVLQNTASCSDKDKYDKEGKCTGNCDPKEKNKCPHHKGK